MVRIGVSLAPFVVGAAALTPDTMSFYSLSATRGDGSTQVMEDCRGKVVYATNVASKWGATRREYAQFKRLGERWGDDLVILGFPTLEFGGQEFTSDEEIKAFAEKQGFPGTLMKLGNIIGDDAPEVWKYLKSESGASDPTWNFNGKFLVDKEGNVSVPKGDVEAEIESLM